MRAVLYRSTITAVILSLSGCNTQAHLVRVDPKRLDSPESVPALRCAYRLADVVDARPNGDHAGGLGRHQLMLDDARTMIKAQLSKAGLREQSVPAAPNVTVQLKRLYLTQSATSKVPIAVYSVGIDDQSPFLLRTSESSINWANTQNEAYEALSQVLHAANVQLIAALNARCVS